MNSETIKLISLFNYIETNRKSKSSKNKSTDKIVEKKDWNHQRIMSDKKGFKSFLLSLTDFNQFKENIKNRKNLFQLEEKEQHNIDNLIELLTYLMENEFDEKSYKCWVEIEIDNYLELLFNQIVERNILMETFDLKGIDNSVWKKSRKFKRERVLSNFIIENLYTINRDEKGISLVNSELNLSKSEYLNQFNLFLNMLLFIQYNLDIEDIWLVGTCYIDDEEKITIQSVIKSSRYLRNEGELLTLYKFVLSSGYQLIGITDSENKQKGGDNIE